MPCGTEGILPFDDEQTPVPITVTMLEPLGQDVTTIASCVRAFARFQRQAGGLLLLVADQIMPSLAPTQLAGQALGICGGAL
ncbi:MAG TPA: hypothetical protein DCZ69_06700 [Syntrophobacteraceae bacterium]|nr:hypothetical protein [Syntrophobacteraceae bacterium]HBD07934.1 hypothetical protein [Syntrophobacteraceae bacterium]HBZ54616.1 hypothetical protein [Syntrophobacteraceae bacterium]